MKNKKGQFVGIAFVFMVAVISLLVVLDFATPLFKTSNSVQSQMNCSNSSLTTNQKISCTTTDISIPIFLAICLGIVGVILGSKIIFGG